MRQILLSFLLASIPVCSPNAQKTVPVTSPTSNLRPTRTEVERFVDVMQLRQRIVSMRETQQNEIKSVSHDMFVKSLPESTAEQKAQYEKIVADEMSALFASYPIDDEIRDVIPIYQSHFTESDLQQIIAFYSSPVGQKVLKEMPAMMNEVTRVSYSHIQPKIQTMMSDLETRIQAIGNEGNK